MEIKNRLTVTRVERGGGARVQEGEESSNMHKGHMDKDHVGGELHVEDGGR